MQIATLAEMLYLFDLASISNPDMLAFAVKLMLPPLKFTVTSPLGLYLRVAFMFFKVSRELLTSISVTNVPSESSACVSFTLAVLPLTLPVNSAVFRVAAKE